MDLMFSHGASESNIRYVIFITFCRDIQSIEVRTYRTNIDISENRCQSDNIHIMPLYLVRAVGTREQAGPFNLSHTGCKQAVFVLQSIMLDTFRLVTEGSGETS